jgi:hypothetical protein
MKTHPDFGEPSAGRSPLKQEIDSYDSDLEVVSKIKDGALPCSRVSKYKKMDREGT